MHKKNSPPSDALFKPFSWHFDPKHSKDELLAVAAHDIANGIELALELIESDELALDAGDAQILNAGQRGVLMRFAITSARLLADSAYANIEFSNDRKRNAQSGRTDDAPRE